METHGERTSIEPAICSTCGVQFSVASPERCPICEDERQYVGWNGQQWTNLTQLRQTYRNLIAEEEPGLYSIVTEPAFGIGQRAFLLQTGEGNVLWDCISLLDEETRSAVESLGGIHAIAISHPHYYSSMVEWSRAFGNAPIHLHEADGQWVMRPDMNIRFWAGDSYRLANGLTLVRSGGHFAGFQVLHWQGGAAGRGVLLAGDQPQVAMDRRWVSFLYSYPNMIPLPAQSVRKIVSSLEPYPFDRLYGAFPGRMISKDAKDAVRRSAQRYLAAIEENAPLE